jgi:selenocysteine lyase/cysteine desulfurase
MNCQKHLFSLRPDIHYLNCGYKSPLLKSAEEASIKALVRERNPVDIAVDDFFSEVSEVRTYFGDLVNCDASNVALIPSSSYGFNSVLSNLKAKKNGNAITIKEEFPSGYFALKRWCDTHQNELIIVEPDEGLTLIGENWNNKLIDAIDENTSIVLISSVHWMNGTKFDLERIGDKCAEVGAKFIVDGTQSVGALSMDVKSFKIDALICAGYKWLFGPYSMGLAYISEQFENGVPLEESWMNRTNAKNFSGLTEYDSAYQPGAGKYNVGETSNFVLMPIMKEGLKQVSFWTAAEIQTYTKNLIQPLIAYLRDLSVEFESDKYFSSHLFALKLPAEVDVNTLKKNLEKNQVYISVRGQYLRVSVNIFNDEKDISQLINSIDETIEK